MKLAELIQPRLVLLDLKETKRTAAIHEVAKLLEKDPDILNFQSFYDELLARERLEATSLGYGVAFPHARTDHVKKMVLAVGRSTAGVLFENSGETIHFIFVIGTPRRMVTEYLALVGAMARLLRNEETRKKLMEAKTPEQFAAVFAEDPEAVGAAVCATWRRASGFRSWPSPRRYMMRRTSGRSPKPECGRRRRSADIGRTRRRGACGASRAD